MTGPVQFIAVLVSAALLLLVLELVRRRALSEEYSLIWISFSLVLLALALRRDLLHAVAGWLGVHYPPAVLLLALLLVVFVASLHFSVIVSRQRRQIERLVEEVAVLSTEVRGLREAAGTAVAHGSTDHDETSGVAARASTERDAPGA